jgi:hypothetical protein
VAAGAASGGSGRPLVSEERLLVVAVAVAVAVVVVVVVVVALVVRRPLDAAPLLERGLILLVGLFKIRALVQLMSMPPPPPPSSSSAASSSVVVVVAAPPPAGDAASLSSLSSAAEELEAAGPPSSAAGAYNFRQELARREPGTVSSSASTYSVYPS